MKSRVTRDFSMVVLLCFCSTFTASAAHFRVSQTFPNRMIITIDPSKISPAASIDTGSFMPLRDEIAVIAPGGDTAGVGIWPAAGNSLMITVYGDVNYSRTSALHPDSLPFSFMVWDSSAGKAFPNTEVRFASGKPLIYIDNDTASVSYLKAVSAPSKLTITSPKGGEKWLLGETRSITWTYPVGTTVGNVRISLSIDDGVRWTQFSTTPLPNNNGSYSWSIPDSILGTVFASSRCRIKVIPTGIPGDPGAVSADVFTLAARIVITSPTANALLTAGGTTSITATTNGNVGNVAIDYNLLNGEGWKTIIGSIAPVRGRVTQSWTIPTTIADSCLVRMYKMYTGTAPANNPIDSILCIIVPPLTIIAPATGSRLTGNRSDTIKWNANYSSGRFKIEYTANANAGTPTWTAIAAAAQNTGKFVWMVSNTPSTNCRVRMTDTALLSRGSLAAVATGVFTIDPEPAFSLTLPNGGEAWAVGSAHDITWTSVGAVDANVKIDFQTKPSGTWTSVTASTANDGSYSWTVPDSISDSCRIKISDAGNSAIFDASENAFSIVAPTITLTSPKGGEQWAAGTQHSISWNVNGAVGNIKIELTTNDADYSTIVASTASSSGSYTWNIPLSATLSAHCRVRISEDSDGTPRDSSRDVFEIVSGVTPTITITFPKGNEQWFTGTAMPITWTSTGIFDSVKIEYTTDSVNWRTIRSATANNGSYTWDIPDTVTPSAKCLVRLTGNASNEPTDKSADKFTLLAPVVTVVAPNGGEAWNATIVNTIVWSSDSIIGKVKIEYSINNGDAWIVIADSANNNHGGSYAWTVPAGASDSCKVRISAVHRPDAADGSDKLFSIVAAPSISVVRPAGGDTFRVGDSVKIAWSHTYVTGKVKIEYSADNGASWALVKDSVDIALNALGWIAPDVKSDSCKIRISSLSSASVVGASSGLFSIGMLPPPSVAIANPTGSQRYNEGDSMIIAWTSVDMSGKIKIECSFDNGKTWSMIKDSVDVSVNRYRWIVARPGSTNKNVDSCKIRITSLAIDSVKTVSEGVFTIIPIVSVLPDRPLVCVLGAGIGSSRTGLQFRVGVPQATRLSVRVFNLSGKEIASIKPSFVTAGYHLLTVPTAALKRGLYVTDVSIGARHFRKVVSYVK